mmetsp:Transcript_8202/g.23536  ORF Transcript_8202/g.23536 Transcript_8202/m.23536 type:complete len:375 (+) Transcript_8202:416-1540(+)
MLRHAAHVDPHVQALCSFDPQDDLFHLPVIHVDVQVEGHLRDLALPPVADGHGVTHPQEAGLVAVHSPGESPFASKVSLQRRFQLPRIQNQAESSPVRLQDVEVHRLVKAKAQQEDSDASDDPQVNRHRPVCLPDVDAKRKDRAEQQHQLTVAGALVALPYCRLLPGPGFRLVSRPDQGSGHHPGDIAVHVDWGLKHVLPRQHPDQDRHLAGKQCHCHDEYGLPDESVRKGLLHENVADVEPKEHHVEGDDDHQGEREVKEPPHVGVFGLPRCWEGDGAPQLRRNEQQGEHHHCRCAKRGRHHGGKPSSAHHTEPAAVWRAPLLSLHAARLHPPRVLRCHPVRLKGIMRLRHGHGDGRAANQCQNQDLSPDQQA